ncbi:flagellar hook-associated family protein [Pseudaminobacter sp. NGMCC 1.201702]|uniref:flagellar hook-associated family protein n=1 Tax=Pseudaminobacter sp. NGMCC 1.201702 TaxID=3391825 RepID=UPI0039EE8DA1
MKTSFVSSSAISQAMRYSMMRNQAALVTAQKESNTGFVADKGLALGTRTTQSISFMRELDRMKNIVDTNALAASRLSVTQSAIGQAADAAQSLLSALTVHTAGRTDFTITKDAAEKTLATLTALLNTNVAGEYIFAGINTDAKPIGDLSFTAPGAAKTDFDAAFLAHFGVAPDDPAAASIDTAAMESFMTTVVEPQFVDAGWPALWSSASDQRIVSRIALNETAETSVSANEIGFRKIAVAAATLNALLSSNIGDEARAALSERAAVMVGEALGDLANLEARTGIVETRIADATKRLEGQSDLFQKHILKTEGVDPYEAATRVSDLLGHIETSYALTARIQQLSLLRFIS